MTCRHVMTSVLLIAALQTNAQKLVRLRQRIDSLLTVRYLRADIDSNYIVRPHTKWTLVGRMNVAGARIKNEGIYGGHHFASELKADYKSTLCASVSYMGLSLSFSLNPAKLLGKYRDYELYVQSYSPRFGFDAAYQDAHNFKGWHEEGGSRQELTTSNDMFKLRTFNVNAYYVFNHRRFSYPAAFVHSYIQRRSAGSFLLTAAGQGQHGKVSGASPMDFKMTNIGIGAGYRIQLRTLFIPKMERMDVSSLYASYHHCL